MPDYKLGSHVRVTEYGRELTGTVIGYSPSGLVLVRDDVQKDINLDPYVWHFFPNEDLTIVPLGDDNA